MNLLRKSFLNSEYIAKGMSTKDAIKEVSKQRKISKNIVYQEYHKK